MDARFAESRIGRLEEVSQDYDRFYDRGAYNNQNRDLPSRDNSSAVFYLGNGALGKVPPGRRRRE